MKRPVCNWSLHVKFRSALQCLYSLNTKWKLRARPWVTERTNDRKNKEEGQSLVSMVLPLGWSRSRSVIQDHSYHGASKEPTSPLVKRILRFLWYTISLGSSILILIIPKKRTLIVAVVLPGFSTPLSLSGTQWRYSEVDLFLYLTWSPNGTVVNTTQKAQTLITYLNTRNR